MQSFIICMTELPFGNDVMSITEIASMMEVRGNTIPSSLSRVRLPVRLMNTTGFVELDIDTMPNSTLNGAGLLYARKMLRTLQIGRYAP